MTPYYFLPSARRDLREERDYYRAISPELAKRFRKAVEAAVALMVEQPYAMQVLAYNVRRWPVDRFPHGVYYRIEEQAIVILAILHPKLDPAKWHSRARD